MIIAAGVALLVLATGVRPHRQLRVVHQSGKWSLGPKALLEALDHFVDELGADVITLTEVSPAHFRRPLERWAAEHGWNLWHPAGRGPGECAILSRLPIVGRRSRQLTKLHLRVGRTAPTFLVSAHVAGWGWLSVLHTPAHTDGLAEHGDARWPTRVYRSILETLAIVGLRSRVFWTVLADWNLHLGLERNRQLLEETFPGLQLINGEHDAPTVGDRDIDGGMTNLEVLGCRTGARAAAKLDHKPKIIDLGQAA